MNKKAAIHALESGDGVGDIINIRKSEHQCHVIMHPYHMTTRGTMQEVGKSEKLFLEKPQTRTKC